MSEVRPAQCVVSILMLALLAAPAVALEPPGKGAAAHRMMAELRVLGAVNALGLTPAQGTALLRVLEPWEQQRLAAERESAEAIRRVEAPLQEALPRVAADPALSVPAEATYRRLLRERTARLQQVDTAARERLVGVLAEQLTPAQQERVLAAARDEWRRLRLADPGAGALKGEVQASLERLRSANAREYPRLRELFARAQAGALEPGLRRAQRDSRPPDAQADDTAAFPPLTDPAARARVQAALPFADQVRALSPAAWSQQRAALVQRATRERRLAGVFRLSSEELQPLFVEAYLLVPGSVAALRRRFVDPPAEPK